MARLLGSGFSERAQLRRWGRRRGVLLPACSVHNVPLPLNHPTQGLGHRRPDRSGRPGCQVEAARETALGHAAAYGSGLHP
ncbi:hypothetical protein NDU88_003675 [Pleurodeles waltl]|uniref:Uncharacterized protein n=1 Tax=Pleurodeles waltl TaxID=8319 RepID=A0AAV7PA94_PLEWA|nr:hypothetical protein NDU88_003675 [Pleurodeles waltl]